MPAKLATINLEVADPERSKRFYVDAFGMTENVRRSHAPGFVYLESSGAHLTLAAPQAGTAAAPSATMELGFEIDDLDGLRERLAACGATGFAAQSMGWGEAIEGRDFDGYRIVAYRLRER